VPKLRNGQTKYSAVFAVHLVQSMKKLGHGKPLVSLRSRDDLAATTIKPGAEPTQRPASGVASAEATEWAN